MCVILHFLTQVSSRCDDITKGRGQNAPPGLVLLRSVERNS